MLAFFLILLGAPLVVAGGSFVFLNGITLKELGLIFVAQLVVAGSSAGIVSCSNTQDVEVWNGVVVDKRQVAVPCSHSYSCNCHQVCTGSGKNRSCTTQCDTCYEHHGFLRTIPGHDYNWMVYTSNSESVNIARIDRQGVREPPRWTIVRLGEPTSLTHGYTNYIKASPGTLFRHQGLKQKYASTLPSYPGHVYDYYKLDRLVTSVDVGEPVAWNLDLMKLNAELGKPKQVNVILVIVQDQPHEWYYALEEKWIGGKKNDAVLVVSVDSNKKPQWAEVMAWTTNELFKVKLRDDVMAEERIDRATTMKLLNADVEQHYVRKPMKDFEYLSSSVTPTSMQWTVTLLIGLFVAVILVVFFNMHDVFDDEREKVNFNPVSGFKKLFNTRPWERIR